MERIFASVAGMVANAVQVVRISHQVEQQQRLLELADSAEAGGCHELAETIRQQARELNANSETDVRFKPGRLAAPVSELPASGEPIAGGAAKSRSRGKAGRRDSERKNRRLSFRRRAMRCHSSMRLPAVPAQRRSRREEQSH